MATTKDAEDIVQEVFVTLWDQRAHIDLQKSIESFLFVMARNKCLNHLKAHRVENNKLDIEDVSVLELQHLYQLDFSGKESKKQEELLIEEFNQAVEKLPSKRRDIFVKCKIEGRKQKDIANELGISVKAIEKQIATAKAEIYAQLIKKFPSLVVIISLILE
jgi:RNA polymerase sigma-70 factor (ECF subfamily)